MASPLDPLILDLVEWIAREPRRYSDVIDSWRTSCPRLTVWEDAVDRGLVERAARGGSDIFVIATPRGAEFLAAHGRGHPVRAAASPPA